VEHDFVEEGNIVEHDFGHTRLRFGASHRSRAGQTRATAQEPELPPLGVLERMSLRKRLAVPAIVLSASAWLPTTGFALPSCQALGTSLSTQPTISEVISVGIIGNRCELLFAVSARGGTAAGYEPGQNQRNVIRIGLPLNSVDGGTGGVQGNWNGKIMHIGGGGGVGTAPDVTTGTDIGYVGSSTDGGHTAAENNNQRPWGVIQATHQPNIGRLDDFAYQSLLDQVAWAKKLTAQYYEQNPTRNYWNGCSTGGRQGISVAIKIGDQFDGILAGAPAIYSQQFRLSDGWPNMVIRDKLKAIGQSLSTGQRDAANQAAHAACSGNVDINGNLLNDGILYDPRACTWSAKNNICGTPGAPASPNCLTPQQADAMDMIWDGPRNLWGKRIWFPYGRGVTWMNGTNPVIPDSTVQAIKWDHLDMTFDANLVFVDDAAIAAAGNPRGAITYADEATLGSNSINDWNDVQDPNLSAARNAGTKILMWQGTQDQLIRWFDSVDYYTRVAALFMKTKAHPFPVQPSESIDYNSLHPWFRYYMAPDVGHCGGGTGPQPPSGLPGAGVGMFNVLVDWVENGVAPDRIIATGGGRSRPLCPYPQRAIYDGTGDPNLASSFICGGDVRSKQTLCEGVRTYYKHENEPFTQFYGNQNEAACLP